MISHSPPNNPRRFKIRLPHETSRQLLEQAIDDGEKLAQDLPKKWGEWFDWLLAKQDFDNWNKSAHDLLQRVFCDSYAFHDFQREVYDLAPSDLGAAPKAKCIYYLGRANIRQMSILKRYIDELRIYEYEPEKTGRGAPTETRVLGSNSLEPVQSSEEAKAMNKLNEIVYKAHNKVEEADEPTDSLQGFSMADNVFTRSGKSFVIKYQGGDAISYQDLDGLFYIWGCLDHNLRSISAQDLIRMRIMDRKDNDGSRASDIVTPYEPEYLNGQSNGRIEDRKSVEETRQNYKKAIGRLRADKEKALQENNNVQADHCGQQIKMILRQLNELTGKSGGPAALIDDLKNSRKRIYAALDHSFRIMRLKHGGLVDHFRNHLIRGNGLQYTGGMTWKTRSD